MTTLTAGAGMLIAVGLAFIAPLLAARVGGPIAQAVRWIRLPLAGVLVAGLWAFVYWALPNTKTRFRLFTPGALVGAGLWVAGLGRARRVRALVAQLRGHLRRARRRDRNPLVDVVVGERRAPRRGSQQAVPGDGAGRPSARCPSWHSIDGWGFRGDRAVAESRPEVGDFGDAGTMGAALSREEAPMTMVYEETLSGRSVIDSTGRSIGEVIALVIDTDAWRIEAVRVKLHKDVTEEIGASHGAFRAARLDVPTAFIHNVSDAVVLSGPIGTLQTLEQQQPSP